MASGERLRIGEEKIHKKEEGLEMWANAQRDGPQPNIGSALYESSVIPFLVPCHKAWLTPAAAVPCSNAANIGCLLYTSDAADE